MDRPRRIVFENVRQQAYDNDCLSTAKRNNNKHCYRQCFRTHILLVIFRNHRLLHRNI